jgi:hypothetical protein
MEARPQSLEEGELRSIAYRIAGRIRLQADIQTHDREPRPELRNHNPLEPGTLEAPDLWHRGSAGSSDIPQAQPGVDPGLTKIFGNELDATSRPTPASIGRPFSRSHWTPSMTAVSWPGLISGAEPDNLIRLKDHRAKQGAQLATRIAILGRSFLQQDHSWSKPPPGGTSGALVRSLIRLRDQRRPTAAA